MGFGDQTRLRQRSQSLWFIFSNFRDSLTRHKFSKEQQPEHDDSSDPQSVLDQHNTNTNTSRSLSLSPTMETKELEAAEKKDRNKENEEEEGRVSDSEDGFMYARSPSFNIYLTEPVLVCKDESKDSDQDKPSLAEDKSNGSHNSDEVAKESEKTEQSGRRFMKARSRAFRRNILLLQHAIRAMRARFTLKKVQ